jgi:hypothetical protein
MWTNRDPENWHRLIAELQKLDKLVDLTPQKRGQRFNYHIAELLQSWGIDARVSIRKPLGEVDVAFTVAGVRYILEAKWQADKADPAQLADLISKISERPTGVRGVFVSMSGFTPEALERVKRAGANIILLDRNHWEAILTGLTPPEEFFNLAADHAAFYGDPYGSLSEIIASYTPPKVSFEVPESLQNGIVHTIEKEGVEAAFVLAVINSNQSGLAIDQTREGHLYLTTEQGIIDVDLAKISWELTLPLTYCHGNVLASGNGTLYFLRHGGVGMVHDGVVSAVGGGMVGATNFTLGTAGDIWVLDNGFMDSATSLIRIGDAVGTEERVDTGISGSTARGVWLDESSILVHGGAGYYIFDLTSKTSTMYLQSQFGSGIVRISSRLVASFDGQTLFLTDLAAQKSEHLAHFHTHGSIADAAMDSAGTIYTQAYFQNGGPMSYAVVSIKGVQAQ